MHPNGAPSTDSAGWSDADHQSNGRETSNTTWDGPQLPLGNSTAPDQGLGAAMESGGYDDTGSQY